jgi:hypothetical protein
MPLVGVGAHLALLVESGGGRSRVLARRPLVPHFNRYCRLVAVEPPVLLHVLACVCCSVSCWCVACVCYRVLLLCFGALHYPDQLYPKTVVGKWVARMAVVANVLLMCCLCVANVLLMCYREGGRAHGC